MSRVSLQFGKRQAVVSADRAARATRVAMDEARAIDAQFATLTSGPWAADVHDIFQPGVLRCLPQISLALALCLT